MIKTTIATLLLCACATLGFAAAGEDEIRKVEAAWADAVKAGDQTKLDKMLADGLVYTHSTGIVEGKSEYLAKLKQGTQKYAGIDASGVGVHMYKDAAVVNSKLRMTGATKGVPFDNTVLCTHMWVKQGGHWQLVAHQTTKLP